MVRNKKVVTLSLKSPLISVQHHSFDFNVGFSLDSPWICKNADQEDCKSMCWLSRTSWILNWGFSVWDWLKFQSLANLPESFFCFFVPFRSSIYIYSDVFFFHFTKTNSLIDLDFRLQHHHLKIRSEIRLKTSVPLKKQMQP